MKIRVSLHRLDNVEPYTIEEAEITLSAQHATPSGRLIVSAPVLFGRLHLAPLLPEFLALYPKLTVDLLLLDRIVNLVEEGIDVAIRPGPLEDSTLIARKLGAFRRVVCAAPSYLERRGKPTRPQDLENHDCIVFTLLDSAQEWSFRTEAGDIKVPVSGRLRTNNQETAVPAHSSNDARNHTRSLKGTPEFERSSKCAQKSRDAFCTPEGPAWLRAYAPSRSHRCPRRVPPRRHCAEPQDDGAASTRPAGRWSVRIDCVSSVAIRLRCSPVRRRRPASSKAKTLPQ